MPNPRLFAENLQDNQRSKCEFRGVMSREHQEGGGQDGEEKRTREKEEERL